MWGLPATAWSRILVLFLALAAIKIALLMGLGRHLGEIHWRVGGGRGRRGALQRLRTTCLLASVS